MTALALAPEFAGQQIRIVIANDEPWFVVADVCAALGLSNPSAVAARVDPDALSQAEVIDSMGRQQQAKVVDEGGLYEIILRSDKPEAKTFRRWVTSEVLPQIRRTGTYAGTQPAIPQTLPEALRLAADLAEERDRAQAALEAQAPKVEAYEALMDTDGYYSMNAAAKAIGIGRNTMFRRLRELDILQSNNLPYQRHAHHFEVVLGTYTDRNGKTHPTATTKVLPSGVDYLRRRLTTVGAVA